MADHSHTNASTAGAHAQVGHVVPVSLLLGVLVVLLLLTWVTVAAVGFDLGPLNIWIAMVIATVKAALVVLYFMHLRYDRPFNAIIFIASLAFVALFIGLALMDTFAYRPFVDWVPAPALQRQ